MVRQPVGCQEVPDVVWEQEIVDLLISTINSLVNLDSTFMQKVWILFTFIPISLLWISLNHVSWLLRKLHFRWLSKEVMTQAQVLWNTFSIDQKIHRALFLLCRRTLVLLQPMEHVANSQHILWKSIQFYTRLFHILTQGFHMISSLAYQPMEQRF